MNHPALLLVAAASISISGCASSIDAPPPSAIADVALAARSQDLLDALYPGDGPGAVAIVTRNGVPVFEGARGLADVAAGEALSPDAPLYHGSIAKTLTATMILMLVDKGELSLDDPIAAHIDGFSESAGRATVGQLLGHVSGLQDYSKLPGYMAEASRSGAATDLTALLDTFKDAPAKSAPGTRFEYNNGGFVVLGAIIEAVTGLSYGDALDAMIARPLGLATLDYRGDKGDDRLAVKGYERGRDGQEETRGAHLSHGHAAGGTSSSLADLARFADALHSGKLVSAPHYARMTAPTRLSDGTEIPRGMGLDLVTLRGRAAYKKGGALGGFRADTLYIPEEEVFVAVVANSEDPPTNVTAATRMLAALALGEPYPLLTPRPADPAAVAPLLGVYRDAEGREDRIFERDGDYYYGNARGETRLAWAGEDRFMIAGRPLDWLQFARTGGRITAQAFEDGDASDVAVRVGDIPDEAPIEAALAAAYVGTYELAGRRYRVEVREGALMLVSDKGDATGLRQVEPHVFLVEAMRARIRFVVEDGRAGKFVLERGPRTMDAVRVD